MVNKSRKNTTRMTGRMIIIFFLFGAIISTLGYTLIHNLSMVNDLKQELTDLREEKSKLLEEEAALEADIKRMSDPLYIARYVREKYFYSKEGEIILRIKE